MIRDMNLDHRLPVTYLGCGDEGLRLKKAVYAAVKREKKRSLSAFVRMCIKEHLERGPIPKSRRK